MLININSNNRKFIPLIELDINGTNVDDDDYTAEELEETEDDTTRDDVEDFTDNDPDEEVDDYTDGIDNNKEIPNDDMEEVSDEDMDSIDTYDVEDFTDEEPDIEENTDDNYTEEDDNTSEDGSGEETDYTAEEPDNDSNEEEQLDDNNQQNNNADTDPDDGSMDDQQDTQSLSAMEKNLFSDLTPEQMAIKNTELLQNYINLHQSLEDVFININKIYKDYNNSRIIDFIADKIIELKDMVNYIIINTYTSRTYVENLVEYKKCLLIFHQIGTMVKSVSKKMEDK